MAPTLDTTIAQIVHPTRDDVGHTTHHLHHILQPPQQQQHYADTTAQILYLALAAYVAVSLAIPLWVPLLAKATGHTGVRWVFSTLTYYAYLAWILFSALVALLLVSCPTLGAAWLALLLLRAAYFFRLGRRAPVVAAASQGAPPLRAATNDFSLPMFDGSPALLRPASPRVPQALGRVLLVGNGPSLASRGLGKQIDAFDTVVRFNSFVTRGLEAHTGSKTSIWCHMMQWYHVSAAEAAQAPQKSAHVCYAWNHVVLAPLFFVPCYLLPMLPARNAVTWSISTYWKAHSVLGLRPHQVPTTGFVMLMRMLEMVDQVHLVGFDGYGSGGELHYYKERQMQMSVNAAGALLHDWEREQHGIRKLMDEGRVVLL